MNKARENCDEELQLFSSELQLVGTIHSHPGNLRTIMSIPDMGLQRAYRHIQNDHYFKCSKATDCFLWGHGILFSRYYFFRGRTTNSKMEFGKIVL